MTIAKALKIGSGTWPTLASSIVFELLENTKYKGKGGENKVVATNGTNVAANDGASCTPSYVQGKIDDNDTSQWHVRVVMNEKCVWSGPLSTWQQRVAYLAPPANDPDLIQACLFKGKHRPKAFQW
jgi:hypothetical protein